MVETIRIPENPATSSIGILPKIIPVPQTIRVAGMPIITRAIMDWDVGGRKNNTTTKRTRKG
jgi:hypothetical protein